LELAFFNSITKFLTILYFEFKIILYFFLLTIIFYILYNTKWFTIFRACSQLAFKSEFKEAWTFFHTNVRLWSVATLFFVGPPKWFLSLQTLIPCNRYGGNFWTFFQMFLSQHTTRPYNYMCPKMVFFLKFNTCTRNGNFGAFLVKT